MSKNIFSLLTVHEGMKDVVETGIRFVATKAPSLGSILSPSLFYNKQAARENWLSCTGSHGCGHKMCTACRFTSSSNTFTSYSNGKVTIKIKTFLNCNTKFVIYLISCTACLKQYVGCTGTPLKVRILRHLSDVQNKTALNISAVSKHFRDTHAGDTFTFLGIEKGLTIAKNDSVEKPNGSSA